MARGVETGSHRKNFLKGCLFGPYFYEVITLRLPRNDENNYLNFQFSKTDEKILGPQNNFLLGIVC